MRDQDCIRFLQWALPRLRMRWPGFRKVRGQVCKRVDRRIRELRLSGPAEYRQLLERAPGEWDVLDACCRITISRFNRDRGVFNRIVHDVLPALARHAPVVRCWSAGCASGEEPYTLSVWAEESDIQLDILATDVDEHMLKRARRGCYQRGTLKDLPDDLVSEAFELTEREKEPYCIEERYRNVRFLQHDVRDTPPEGAFNLILCRNLAFMYFDASLQRDCLDQFLTVLRPEGGLVIGAHEELPDHHDFKPWYPESGIYRRN